MENQPFDMFSLCLLSLPFSRSGIIKVSILSISDLYPAKSLPEDLLGIGKHTHHRHITVYPCVHEKCGCELGNPETNLCHDLHSLYFLLNPCVFHTEYLSQSRSCLHPLPHLATPPKPLFSLKAETITLYPCRLSIYS